MLRFIPLWFVASIALAAPVQLDPSSQVTFTDCSSTGSVAQTVNGGNYLVTATDEDVYLCMATSASTCASGGVRLPSGFAAHIAIPRTGRSVSCRSAGATGDLQFTSAN